MSDGREERKEQEERRRWETEKRGGEKPEREWQREWEQDGDRERRDS